VRELKDDSLINLALYRTIFPKSQLVEVKAFLYIRNQNNNNNNIPFSDSQILRAEERLDLTRKAASTTAAKAFLPCNLQLRHMYFHNNYPLGIADINTDDMIDSDEAGFFLESTNRGYGKTVRGDRCDEEGAYDKCSEKLNVLCGICCDRNNPMRWIDTWTGEGTTIIKYYTFISRICDDLDNNYPGRSFCFTMDNLNSHKHPLVLNEILNRGHKCVFRAPYWAVDGAIEYVFNTMNTMLMIHYNELRTIGDLENNNSVNSSKSSQVPFFFAF